MTIATRAIARVERALDDIRAGKMVILVDDEDRENEGDLDDGRRERDARGDQLHGHARARPHLPHAHRGAGRRARAADECGAQGAAARRSAPRSRCQHRGAPRRHDRHQRRRSRAHDPRRGRPRRAARGSRHARPRLPAARASAAACSCAPGRPRARSISRGSPASTPAGVICEIMNDDGTMARMPDLEVFAQKHGLRILTIADLIQYRLQHRALVEQRAEATLRAVAARAPADGVQRARLRRRRSRRPSTSRSRWRRRLAASRCSARADRLLPRRRLRLRAVRRRRAPRAPRCRRSSARGAACSSTCIPRGATSLLGDVRGARAARASRRAWPAREHNAARVRPRRAGAGRPRPAQTPPPDEQPAEDRRPRRLRPRASSSACRWRCRRHGTTSRSCATSAIAKATCTASTRAAQETRMPRMIEGQLVAPRGLRVRAVVATRFNSFIVERLVDGALDALVRTGGGDGRRHGRRAARARGSCRRWRGALVERRRARRGDRASAASSAARRRTSTTSPARRPRASRSAGDDGARCRSSSAC